MLSQYTDKAEVAWVGEVWTKSYDELADSGPERFHLFDALVVSKEKKEPPKVSRSGL